jgi:hypothetical protein
MLLPVILLLGALAPLGCGSSTTKSTPTPMGQTPSTEAELKAARAVAADFLKAASGGNSEEAEALMTPALLKRITARYTSVRSYLDIWSNSRAALTSGKLLPSGNGAVFLGVLTTDKGKFNLTLRVAKTEKGLWKVDAVDAEKDNEPGKEETKG